MKKFLDWVNWAGGPGLYKKPSIKHHSLEVSAFVPASGFLEFLP